LIKTSISFVIPAQAGMTTEGAGMTNEIKALIGS